MAIDLFADAWPGQSPGGCCRPDKQVKHSSCHSCLAGKPHVFVHVDGIGIRRSYKEVHKVALVHLGGRVLQDLHELLRQPLPPAQARCNIALAPGRDICTSSALQQSASRSHASQQ